MNATLVVLFSNKSNVGPVIAEGKKGGDREEEIQNSHSTPWIVHADSSFICTFGSETWAAGGAVPLLPLLPLYNRNKELRIHPDEKMGFERLANRNCMECPTPARAFRSTNPLFQGHLC